MKKSTGRRTAQAVVLALLATGLTWGAFSLPLEKRSEEKPTVYEAIMVGTRGPVGARSIRLTIRINGYTSDEEIKEYLKLIKENSGSYTGALRKRLEKVKGLGNISPVGYIGTDLAVVRERDTDEGKLITLVTARQLSFGELYRLSRSTDYPFSFLQLLVDEEGKGQGTVILAARAKFDEEGQLEIESYGLQPFQLLSVRRR